MPGGSQQSFLWEGSAQKSNPFIYPALLCTIFVSKGSPFIYLVKNFASLLTAENALSFK